MVPAFQKLCDKIAQQLLEEGCKVIVIACNTARAKAVKHLRKKYLQVLFVAIEPAYRMVYDKEQRFFGILKENRNETIKK